MDPLSPLRDQTLDLEALVSACESLLRAAGITPSDDRVTPFPDRRTLRYYQTLGILDRPLRYDGRQAIYGFRHLLQAVATKLLQAQGHSLTQVQGALTGLDTARLESAVRASLLPAPSAQVPSPPAPLPTSRRALIAVEVAPGVVVTLDPEVVPDPQAVLARIANTLNQ